MSLHKTDSGRLRESGARKILELRKSGKTYQDISIELDVCPGTVYNVCKGRTWGFLVRESKPS